MSVSRVVPNLPVSDVSRAAALYTELLGLGVAMDHGWVASLSPDGRGDVQLQLLAQDAAASCNPAVSVGVTDPAEVDRVHERVSAAGLEIVHGPVDEDWGVRRFFFRDPDGNVVNVVANLPV